MQQLTAFKLGLTHTHRQMLRVCTELYKSTIQTQTHLSKVSIQQQYQKKNSQQCEPGFIAVVLFGNQKKNPLMTGNSSQPFYDFITLSKHTPENINTNNKQTKEKGEKLIGICFARRYS